MTFGERVVVREDDPAPMRGRFRAACSSKRSQARIYGIPSDDNLNNDLVQAPR